MDDRCPVNCEYVIFEEYRRHVDVKFGDLLRLLDGYPGMRVERKGGIIPWRPKVIFFTAPKSLDDTFVNTSDSVYSVQEGQFEQLIFRTVVHPYDLTVHPPVVR